MTVLVIGDANVDLDIRLPEDAGVQEHGNPDPRLFGGGSAANTAAALARLGVATRFVGAVGDDAFGRFAVTSLEEAGVDASGMVVAPELPTVTVITVKQPDGERLIYVWPPSGGAHAALEPGTAVAALAGVSWLHVSGICLRVSPAREALLTAMERARTMGVPVSFDLNLRLENWGWGDGFRGVVMSGIQHSDVVLGSGKDEIGALVGEGTPTAAAAALATVDASGNRVVVARLGSGGAVASSRGGVVAEPGVDVEVVDTVGAGDAFNAGFIAAQLDGEDLATSLRMGNAVAGLAIGRPGARSTPTRSELEQFVG